LDEAQKGVWDEFAATSEWRALEIAPSWTMGYQSTFVRISGGTRVGIYIGWMRWTAGRWAGSSGRWGMAHLVPCSEGGHPSTVMALLGASHAAKTLR